MCDEGHSVIDAFDSEAGNVSSESQHCLLFVVDVTQTAIPHSVRDYTIEVAVETDRMSNGYVVSGGDERLGKVVVLDDTPNIGIVFHELVT